jgi:hypothetical protein
MLHGLLCTDSQAELEAMKKKLKELEEEAERLRALQVRFDAAAVASRWPGQGAEIMGIALACLAAQRSRWRSGSSHNSHRGSEGGDGRKVLPRYDQAPDCRHAAAEAVVVVCRSVYVGNVDYQCTPEELQQLFQVRPLVHACRARCTHAAACLVLCSLAGL